MKKTIFSLILVCAVVASSLAKASAVLPFDVARTEEQVQQMSETTDAQLDAHIDSIANVSISEQIQLLLQMNEQVLLARILASVTSLMKTWDPDRTNAVVALVNTTSPGVNLSVTTNADGTVTATATSVDPTVSPAAGSTPGTGSATETAATSFDTETEVKTPDTASQPESN